MNGPDLSVYSQQLQKLSPDSRFVSWSQRPTHQLPPGEMYSGVEPAHEYGPMEAVYNFQLTKDQVYRFLNTSDQRKQQIIDRVFKDYLDEVRGALPESQQSKTFGELIPVIQTNRVFDGILKLALSSVSNCDSCDASKAIMNLYFGWQALSVSAQAADSEAKFVEVMNQFDKTFSVPHFGYEYARVLMMAVTDQPWVDGPHGLAYHLEVSNQKLLGTKPLLKSSEQRTEEGELLPKQFTVNLVSSYGRYQDQAYFYGEVPFLKSSQLGVNDAAKVFSGREGIETYSCECFYSDEDPRSLKPFGFVEGHFIASGSEESKVNRLLGVCKTAAERRDLVQEGKKQLAPVAYVSVPRKSCRKDSWKVSAAERTQLRATFLELKTELAKKAAQQCRHNYLFSSMPNWFRLSLATLLGGYGWRVRGGLVDLGGTTTNRLTGMGFLAAAAYVSSNNSETFFDGLSA
ncbi:MAG: hypothetical protein KDD43_12335, partial [Bdellovibrionales bacterium]|nr:hypothetical protein [Bdellovibrionales bacterium]